MVLSAMLYLVGLQQVLKLTLKALTHDIGDFDAYARGLFNDRMLTCHAHWWEKVRLTFTCTRTSSWKMNESTVCYGEQLLCGWLQELRRKEERSSIFSLPSWKQGKVFEVGSCCTKTKLAAHEVFQDMQ